MKARAAMHKHLDEILDEFFHAHAPEQEDEFYCVVALDLAAYLRRARLFCLFPGEKKRLSKLCKDLYATIERIKEEELEP
jgi:hypothetical protein